MQLSISASLVEFWIIFLIRHINDPLQTSTCSFFFPPELGALKI